MRFIICQPLSYICATGQTIPSADSVIFCGSDFHFFNNSKNK